MRKKFLSMLTSLVMAVGLVGAVPAHAEDIVNYKSTLATNGQWRNGYIGYNDDEREYDYYPIYISTAGKLTITMQSFGNLYFHVLDSDYDEMDSFDLDGSAGTPTNGIFSRWLEKGTYYVRATEDYWSDASGNYRVKASFTSAKSNEKEPNDTYLQAQSVSNGSTIIGTITYYDEHDYYKINVSKKMQYNFYLSVYDTKTYFTLYDNNLNDITDNWNDYCNPDETKNFSYTLNKGVYYVKISKASYYNGNSKYIIKFNPSSSSGKSQSSNSSVNKSSIKKTAKVKKPAKVTGFTIKKLSKRTAKVSWRKVKGAKGYQLKWSTYKNFSYANKKSTKKTKLILNYSYSDKYYVKVRAFKKVGGKRVYGKYSKAVRLSV